ncbi:MAG: PQQ-binding-like beta-propeller repeat protein [Planctomycetota bacterium]
MQKNEYSAWTILLGAMVLGSISTVTLGGCKPPTAVEVDVSTAEYVSNTTGESDDVAESSNVTTSETVPTSPSEAIETPVDDSETTSKLDAETATKLVAAFEEVAPDAVVDAGGDWPQWGGTREKNNVPGIKELPLEWNIGKFDRRTGAWDKTRAVNVNWFANLGSQTYGNPVIADGRVYVGTNNGAGYLKRYPSKTDLGCLLAFEEKTGKILWQHSSEKLPSGREHDWPLQGICCSPLVEGDRLWFVTSRGEVRCLDTKGFYDGEDDGSVKNELATVAVIETQDASELMAAVERLKAGQLTDAVKTALSDAGEPVSGDVKINELIAGKEYAVKGSFNGVDRTITVNVTSTSLQMMKTLGVDDKLEADVIWVYDMMGPEMGISQHNMCSCSVTGYGDFLFVSTGNGLNEAGNLPAPEAPSFICMDKTTGNVLWTDRSPGMNILHGQWSSPAVGVFDGVPQVLFGGGDGILYSFRADAGSDGKPELLWKFDCNPKTSKWIPGGEGNRNNLIGTPVVYDSYVYIAVGQDPEHGEGEGHLWCIDPTKRGDISPTLAMKAGADGKQVPVPQNRIQAVNEDAGEVEVANPNSGAVWHYTINDANDDGQIDFEEEMHRTIGTVAIKDDVLYIADFSGLVHCLDAKGTKEGEPVVHFTYDMLAQSWGSPLIAAGHVFIGDEDGDVAIFEFGAENNEPIDEINMGSSVYSTPVGANDTLFISTKDKLFSIGIQD